MRQRTHTPRSQRTKMGLMYVYGYVHTEVCVCYYDFGPTPNMHWCTVLNVIKAVRGALGHALWPRGEFHFLQLFSWWCLWSYFPFFHGSPTKPQIFPPTLTCGVCGTQIEHNQRNSAHCLLCRTSPWTSTSCSRLIVSSTVRVSRDFARSGSATSSSPNSSSRRPSTFERDVNLIQGTSCRFPDTDKESQTCRVDSGRMCDLQITTSGRRRNTSLRREVRACASLLERATTKWSFRVALFICESRQGFVCFSSEQ